MESSELSSNKLRNSQQKEELHDNSHKLSRLLLLYPRPIMQVYKVHHFAAYWYEEVKDSKGVRVNPKSYALDTPSICPACRSRP